MSDEDVVVVMLARRIRSLSAAEYERFLRLAVKSLQVAELQSGAPDTLVDLTRDSSDELRFM